MQINKANETHIPAIIAIAKTTWYDTYTRIIRAEQIRFMLNLFYTTDVLQQQMNDDRHHFWVLEQQGDVRGYAHCIDDDKDQHKLKLSKLYVLPGAQGSGIGKMLLKHIEDACVALRKTVITLNVNRTNPARFFYEKMGFQIVEDVDIPLGNFWLNDHVMEKLL